MEDSKLERINELAHKSRIAPLNDAELAEQAELRKEYIAAYRSNLKSTLDRVKFVDKK